MERHQSQLAGGEVNFSGEPFAFLIVPGVGLSAPWEEGRVFFLLAGKGDLGGKPGHAYYN